MKITEGFYFEELRAKVGKGSGLYVQDSEDGLYRLMIPAIEVPVPSTTTNSIEIKVACSATVTKLESTKVIEEAEAPFYVHRDVIRILERMQNKPLNFLAKTGEFTGFKFSGTVSYKADNIKMDEAQQGTIKIVPATAPEYVDDVYEICKPTARFLSAVPSIIELEYKDGTESFALAFFPEDAQVTVKSSKETVATGAYDSEKKIVTITGKAKGSAVIDINVKKEGYADWTTSVHVIAPETAKPTQE